MPCLKIFQKVKGYEIDVLFLNSDFIKRVNSPEIAKGESYFQASTRLSGCLALEKLILTKNETTFRANTTIFFLKRAFCSCHWLQRKKTLKFWIKLDNSRSSKSSLKVIRNAQKPLREKCSNTEFFLVFLFLYSNWIQENTENTDKKKLRIWKLFMQWTFCEGRNQIWIWSLLNRLLTF